jgi:hypothetical protein
MATTAALVQVVMQSASYQGGMLKPANGGGTTGRSGTRPREGQLAPLLSG